MPYSLLRSVRVIEWGEVFTAPFCGKLLTDLGAEVIKVEALPGGDPGRGLPPFAGEMPSRQRSLMFSHLNAGKRGLALDAASDAGLALLRGLLAEADALVIDRPVAERERQGLTYEALHAAFPRLVVASILPFGETGPRSGHKGDRSLSFHMSGASHANPLFVPTFDHPPLLLPGNAAGITGGLIGAAGTMMAVLAARLTGEGRHVDMAEVETVIPMLADPLDRYNFEGQDEPRAGRIKGFAPFDFYRVQDGWASMFLVQEAHWQRLMKMMGDPDWARAEQFADRRRRAQYREDMDALMEAWLLQQRNEDLYVRAQASDIPIGPARTMDKVVLDPQLAHRGALQAAGQPPAGAPVLPAPVQTGAGNWSAVPRLAPPYKVAGDDWLPPAAAPRLGEHTAQVLTALLGLSARELAALAAAGVVA